MFVNVLRANIGAKGCWRNLRLRRVELAKEELSRLFEDVAVALRLLVVEQSFHDYNFVDIPKTSVHLTDSDELLGREA